MFCGLAIYAIAGCYAQDLRVNRQEGSVGTVLKPGSDDVTLQLKYFYENTSFIPFNAVIDGRQPLAAILTEFPIIPFVIGLPLGAVLEINILEFIHLFMAIKV